MDYIHYSSRPEPPQVPPRAMNQFAGGSGPLGVYTYQEGVRETFGSTRKYRFVLTPTVPVLDTRRYSAADLERDLAILATQVDTARALRLWAKYKSNFRAADLPFSALWYVVTHVSRDPDPDTWAPASAPGCSDPKLARDLLVGLGHEVIDDRLGILYASEPEQAVFLTDSSFKVVDMTTRNGLTRNPPQWIASALAESYELLEAKVPPEWLPKLASVKAGPRATMLAEMPEYGCGAYGCVLPTLDHDVVLKVTTDETEAEFAASMANELEAPVCVKYFMVVKLSATHKKAPIHLLWREAAEHVGKIGDELGPEAALLIDQQHRAAQDAYKAVMMGWPADSIHNRIRAWLERCEQMARQTKIPGLRPLGEGLVFIYQEQRVLFGDIHAGNLGLVGGRWVITDPGNIAVIGEDAW